MKCEKCHKNEATVFITQNINGDSMEMNLCESCAAESKNSLVGEGLSFQQFLSGLLETSKNYQRQNTQTACPTCNMTMVEFKQNSKVGCADCYQTFAHHLQPIIKRLQGGTTLHTGKRPSRIDSNLQVKKQLAAYESDLKLCLMQEDYEQAAVLRDQIRNLKKEAGL